MPELPEVEIVRQSLYKKINKKKVNKVIVRNRNLRFKIPANFSSILENQKRHKSFLSLLNTLLKTGHRLKQQCWSIAMTSILAPMLCLHWRIVCLILQIKH